MGYQRQTGEEQSFAVPHSTSFSNIANETMLQLITVIYNELNIEMKV
jgi:hypothetical protein